MKKTKRHKKQPRKRIPRKRELPPCEKENISLRAQLGRLEVQLKCNSAKASAEIKRCYDKLLDSRGREFEALLLFTQCKEAFQAKTGETFAADIMSLDQKLLAFNLGHTGKVFSDFLT